MNQSLKHLYNCNLTRLHPHKLKMGVLIAPDRLPSYVDLRYKIHEVMDQGRLGSCTANAICALVRYRTVNFNPSRLFVYYNERNMEGTTSTDSGAYLGDGIKSLQQIGVCPELAWPYNIERFADPPTPPCYELAKQHLYTKSFNIDNSDLEQIKTSLFNNNPFVFGIAVYESFESEEVAKTGIVPMPQESERLLGGHAIMCCGYSDEKQSIICLNSWGSAWGDGGFFYLPYEYVTDTSKTSDAWSIMI